MTSSRRAATEDDRLAALRSYRLLDTPAEAGLDELTELAAAICSTPISLIALVDESRQWFKSRVGFEAAQTPRDVSFCAHVLDQGTPLIVPDASQDSRFAANPLVTGRPGIRFYAGAPLTTPDGHVLGALCVMDRVPRQLTEDQVRGLTVLGRQVMAQFEVRRKNDELQQEHTRLQESEERFAKFFYSSPVPLLIARLRDSAILDVNDAWERTTGYLRAHSLGRSVAELGMIPAHANDAYRALLTSTGSILTDAVPYRHANGEERLGLGSAALVPLQGETHAVATFIDVTDFKRVERSLRDSEEHLRLALDAARVGTYDWDMTTGRLAWSSGHEKLWGLEPGTFASHETFAERVHPDDLPGVNAEVERCIEAHAPFERQFRVVWPDGSVHWALSRGEFDFDDTGSAVRMRGVVEDITERVAAEALLRDNQRQAEARLRQLNRVYAMLGGISEAIVRERDQQSLLAAACRITVATGGFRMAWIGLFNGSRRLQVMAHAGADAGALTVIERLVTVVPPDGCSFTDSALRTGRHAVCSDIAGDPATASWRHEAVSRGCHSMVALPLVSDGRPIGVFNLYAETDVFDAQELRLLDDVAADISFAIEVQRRDAERRRAEERFRLVVENIQEVFWISDPSGLLEFVSPAYETIWGRSRDELYAQPDVWLAAIHPDDRARVADAFRSPMGTGTADEHYRILRPDGSARWIRARTFPVRNATGQIERIIGTAADITSQRQLEEQFRQAQKMESVGRLAGGIAHDFNNLLTVINGTAELAAFDLPRDAPLRSDLVQIRQAGDRAAALTRQLLALSRQQILQPAIISLTSIVQGMQSMLRRLIGEHVELAFVLRDGIGYVKADPSQIEQVILNLAVNAQDAMPDGGTLAIETGTVYLDSTDAMTHLAPRPGTYVMLAISDTGVGMDDATRERIFEPFFTTKELGKGTGLGLSTVYGIVQQSEGGVFVYSEPGRGSTFKVYLPRVDQDPATEAAATVSDSSGTETILLVEDEAGLRTLTRRILVSAGYTVLEAGSGDEALDVLARHAGPVHLMLTDVVMPGMNGRDLALRVAQTHPKMKVLYASGYTDDTIFRHGVLDDGSRFISKPFAPGELRRKIREILD